MSTNGNGNGAKKTTPKGKKATEQSLRDRREALGLSRARVADEAGVPVSRVWAAEQPEAGVTDEIRESIVAVLNAHRNAIAKMPPLA